MGTLLNHLQLTDNQIGTINYIWVVMNTHVLPTELFCSIQSTSKTYDCVKNYLYVSVLGTCHFVYNSLTQIFVISYCFEIRIGKHNEGLNHLLNLDLRVFTAACLSGWSYSDERDGGEAALYNTELSSPSIIWITVSLRSATYPR